MIIAVASGKGGTGKTTVLASLVSAWKRPVLAVDLDVEEPNLHLFLKPEAVTTEPAPSRLHDLSPDHQAATHVFCETGGIPLVGHLPHDSAVTEAMVRRQAVIEGPDTPFGTNVRQVWLDLQSLLEEA